MKRSLLITIAVFSYIFSNAQSADSLMRKHITDSLNEIKAKPTEVWSPEPPVVTPGATPQDAPSDAVILFNGKDLNSWESANDTTKLADWIIDNGELTVNKKGGGSIQTKQKFMDYQLHIEWKEPTDIEGKGQARGNSGVFLASTGPGDEGYEIQVLDCYNNTTYVNGQTAAVYKQRIPLANACKKPGEW
ncbi:MAG: DUF1080 domain-containing protein, partial [Parafilimonas sp.]